MSSSEYPDYDDSWPDYVFGHLYEEPGMKKWGGFYLSDHTAKINDELQTKESVENQSLQPSMDLSDILNVIAQAVQKNLNVCYQVDSLTVENGHRTSPPILSGTVNGYDSTGIFIDKQLVEYTDIRWVKIIEHN